MFILCHYYHTHVRSKERAQTRDAMTISANEVETQDFTSESADLQKT